MPPILTDQVLEQYKAEDHLRLVRIKRAWDAYHGDLPKPLQPTKSDPLGNDNIRLNYARLIVRIGMSFLFGKEPDWEIGDVAELKKAGKKPEDSPEDQYLDDFWEFNKGLATLEKIAINGGVCGHVFVKIVIDPVKYPDYPRLVILDPATVTPYCTTDDYEDIWLYKIQWNAVDFSQRQPRSVTRRQLIWRSENEQYWEIIDQVTDQFTHGWKEISRQNWMYPWPPVFHCQNLPIPNVFWGEADIDEDILGLNYGMNFVLSNAQRIIRHHAHPKTWGKGISSSDIDMSVDGIICIPGTEGELHNLEMASDGAFTIELYKRVKEALHETSQIPEVATGKVDNIGALSGIALETLYKPVLEKTGVKRSLYGPMLNDINRRALELKFKEQNPKVGIAWQPLTPEDAKETAEALILHEQLGVSKETLVEKLGYDAEEEMKRKEEEQKTQMTMEAQMGDKLLSAFDGGRPMGRGGNQNAKPNTGA